jgi:hypothetical protein
MPLRKCPYCKGLSNFDVAAQAINPRGIHLWLDRCQNCGQASYFATVMDNRDRVIDCYPKPDTQIDDELPEDVKTAFKQAIESLNNGLWDGCVVMARRTIEEAVRELDAKGSDLFHKIDYLEEQRKITPALKEWAHETRLAGKLGAHGSGEKKFADKEDAEEITEFCRWFLRYLFVLPKQLAERRAKITKEDKSSDNSGPLLP